MGLVPAIVGLEVELHRTLATVPGGEGGFTAGGVAAGALHLDDIGALVGEEHAEQGAGDVLSEFDYADATEGALGLGAVLGGGHGVYPCWPCWVELGLMELASGNGVANPA